MNLYRCGKCGSMGTLRDEEANASCSTCGQQLDVYVRSLTDPDESDLAELREEELAFDRISGDVDCES
jgi:DNA-directed RNA polymerase subunit RPC12/RpoP